MYRIQKIELTSGIDITPGNLTIAIGPNNGGKSQFLKDLVATIANTQHQKKSIRDITPDYPKGPAHVLETILHGVEIDENGNAILDVTTPDFQQPQQLRISPSQLGIGRDSDYSDDERKRVISQNLGRHLVSHLTTERRLLLVKRQVNRQANIEGSQSPIEAARSAESKIVSWIDERVQAAFGTKLVLDDAVFAAAEFRLGDTNGLSHDREERRRQIQQLPQLDDQGDGIRSFCGVLVAAAAYHRPVIVIDEPEAFLHPPQAYLIGRALAELREQAQIFVATHSAEVLRGILSVTTDTTVVRFSRPNSSFAAKILNPVDLKQITSDPVLSSARVLDGLFYSGVAVTESDGDVALYRSVLSQFDSSASIGFVNSYSKQTSAKIAVPFHAMGVPCAIVVDFDMLRVRDEFKNMYEALHGDWSVIEAYYDSLICEIEGIDSSDARLQSALTLMEEVRTDIGKQGDAGSQLVWLRARLKDVRDRASVWGELKKKGVDGLPKSARSHYDFINGQCKRIGLFIVSAGEREGWLDPQVAYTNNKRHWTELAVRYLAANVLPESHRLREFVSALREHCSGDPV